LRRARRSRYQRQYSDSCCKLDLPQQRQHWIPMRTRVQGTDTQREKKARECTQRKTRTTQDRRRRRARQRELEKKRDRQRTSERTSERAREKLLLPVTCGRGVVFAGAARGNCPYQGLLDPTRPDPTWPDVQYPFLSFCLWFFLFEKGMHKKGKGHVEEIINCAKNWHENLCII
jgi:hypothetical protein